MDIALHLTSDQTAEAFGAEMRLLEETNQKTQAQTAFFNNLAAFMDTLHNLAVTANEILQDELKRDR